jgi:hypothetical protein
MRGFGGVGPAHRRGHDVDRLILPVAALQHVEVDQRLVLGAVARGVNLDRGGVDRDGTVERIRCLQVADDLRPALDHRAVVLGEILREIPRQVGLAGGAPDHGPGAVAGDEVAPVGLELVLGHPVHEPAPGADEAGGDALRDEMGEAFVGPVEILRPDVCE